MSMDFSPLSFHFLFITQNTTPNGRIFKSNWH
jgi:hypothetical protein